MSGPTTKAVYTADDGNEYAVRLPTWEYAVTNAAADDLQNGSVASGLPGLPKGVRRRKRYYVITATGKEGSITALRSNQSLWTSPVGDPLEVPLFGAAAPGSNNATLRGRTGERTKAI